MRDRWGGILHAAKRPSPQFSCGLAGCRAMAGRFNFLTGKTFLRSAELTMVMRCCRRPPDCPPDDVGRRRRWPSPLSTR
jgi:hypothetical protein